MSGLNNGTVLLVDDEGAVLRALSRVLRPLGCRILTAESGAAGVLLLEQYDIDLVISDMRMVGMSGAEFLSLVSERWPHVDRVLLTGYSDLESTIDAINRGKISRYLNKPWDEQEIVDVVTNGLRAAYLQQQNTELKDIAERQNTELKELNLGLEDKVLARTAELEASEQRLKIAYERIASGYRAMVRVFSSLVQRRMKSQFDHEHELGMLLVKMAQRLGYAPTDLKQLHYAWLLRNVGKVGFSDELIATPYIELHVNAQRQFQKHPLLAHATIMAIKPLDLAATLISQHKEMLDGSGYPRHRKADQIDPRAQLLAVVNDYQELTSGVLQKRAFSSDEAIAYLRLHAGLLYRKDAVELLIELLPKQSLEGRSLQDKAILTIDMQLGMVLSRDLYLKGDILLLTKGFVLDESSMERLRDLELNMDENFELYVVFDSK